MGSEQRREEFRKILAKFHETPFVFDRDRNQNKAAALMQKFLVSYLGMCFIQGYRIFQQPQPNIFILSLLDYQHLSSSPEGCIKINEQYRVLYIDFKEDLNEDHELRRQIFTQLKGTLQTLKKHEPENKKNYKVHFVFASNHKFSIVDEKMLVKGSGITLVDFYERGYGIERNKYSIKILDERSEGTKLHEMVELLLKGSGSFRSPRHLYDTLYYNKFSYNLEAVINTICFIIGKQILENSYVTITSQKWMRKSTEKKFKRFDLLMRKEDKVCIIDWKFSKTEANEKIMTGAFVKKNKEYFQLARKQYNAPVQLKFYCFHHKLEGKYHKFSSAKYDYQPEQFEIQDEDCDFQQNLDDANPVIDNDSNEIEELIEKQTTKAKQKKQKKQQKRQKPILSNIIPLEQRLSLIPDINYQQKNKKIAYSMNKVQKKDEIQGILNVVQKQNKKSLRQRIKESSCVIIDEEQIQNQGFAHNQMVFNVESDDQDKMPARSVIEID